MAVASSRTAKLGLGGFGRSGFLLLVGGCLGSTLLEALHPATGVDELLLTGEERMALVAQFGCDLVTVERVGESFPQEQCTRVST